MDLILAVQTGRWRLPAVLLRRAAGVAQHRVPRRQHHLGPVHGEPRLLRRLRPALALLQRLQLAPVPGRGHRLRQHQVRAANIIWKT